jgi:asparagine synthase (glutamine-hydrolysing)
MCGIAGIIDLSGEGRPLPHGSLRAMAEAIVHRGPDEDGFLERPGLGLASRRLSIVGLSDGKQPIWNEDRSIAVVFNGELFDYPEQKAALERLGHRFATHCDTEVIPHRYEEHEDNFLSHLHGQFAFALFDANRRRLVLARDQFGICPLHWTVQNTPEGDWLLFASEIKALLASGMVEARTEVRGLNHLFTFFAMPGPLTCFAGVRQLQPGHCLRVDLGGPGQRGRFTDTVYWDMDFPDQGQEDYETPTAKLVEGLESLLLSAVERRLRADVPVVSYLSGGVDSSTVVAMASKIRGTPIPAFTIQIKAKGLDETSEAGLVARRVGCEPVIVGCGAEEVMNTYPALIEAAEAPVVDTSAAALLLLAREVHARGYKVALTGEGADEWLGGYPWHKFNRALSWFDVGGVPISQWLRRGFLKLTGAPRFPWSFVRRSQASVGGHNGWLDVYGLMGMAKLRLFTPQLLEQLLDHVPYDDLGLNRARLNRWHPLNRELHLSGRCHLAGLLLNAKGDRVAMASSVETRYPFLDEEVFAYLARIPPRLKLLGLSDKRLLRMVAGRYLPHEVAYRRKAMFRAPFDSFNFEQAPSFIGQLLSPESLRRTGYFDPAAVAHWRATYRSLREGWAKRTSVEMGLVGVVATQLWHHTYIDGSLCDLPSRAVRPPGVNNARPVLSPVGQAASGVA